MAVEQDFYPIPDEIVEVWLPFEPDRDRPTCHACGEITWHIQQTGDSDVPLISEDTTYVYPFYTFYENDGDKGGDNYCLDCGPARLSLDILSGTTYGFNPPFTTALAYPNDDVDDD